MDDKERIEQALKLIKEKKIILEDLYNKFFQHKKTYNLIYNYIISQVDEIIDVLEK